MKRFHQLVAFLPALLVAACGGPSSPDEWDWYLTYDIGHIALDHKKTVYRDSVVVTEQATASFTNEDTVGLFAGRVTINGVSLPRYHTPDASGSAKILYKLTSDSGAVPIELGGKMHRLVVEGGPNVPPIVDSARSPQEVELIRPLIGDTISRSKGFEVTWHDAPSSEGTKVQVMVVGLGDTATIVDHILQFETPDGRGGISVSAKSLADFPPGPVWIVVRRMVHHEGKTRDPRSGRERKYGMDISSTLSLSLPMKE